MEKISPHKYVYSFCGIINLICMVNVVCNCKQNRLAKPFFSIEDLLTLVIHLWIIWFPFDIVKSLRLKYLKITSVHMFKCNRELKTRKKRQH